MTPPTIDAPERREAVESVRDAALALVVRSRLSLATEVIKLRRALIAASSGERGAALEEAARVAERLYADPAWNGFIQAGARGAATAIRALATPATVEDGKV